MKRLNDVIICTQWKGADFTSQIVICSQEYDRNGSKLFGRKYFLPYRTKKQYAEIVAFIKLFRQEDITLKRILSDYSVKMGQYVNEPKLRKEIKDAFGFSKSAIDMILSIH